MKKILASYFLFSLAAFGLSADSYYSQGYNQPGRNYDNSQYNQGYNQPGRNYDNSQYNQGYNQNYDNSQYNQGYNQSGRNYDNSQYNQGYSQPYGSYDNSSQRGYNSQAPYLNSYDSQGYQNQQSNGWQRYHGNNQSNYNNQSRAYNDNSSDKYPQDRFQTGNDKEINKKIRDKITGWFTDSYKNIQLNTANGVVTIEGFVETFSDKNKLNDELKNVDGVRSVNNNVQVKNKSS